MVKTNFPFLLATESNKDLLYPNVWSYCGSYGSHERILDPDTGQVDLIWRFFIDRTSLIPIPILDGNSDIGVHGWSDIGYLICLGSQKSDFFLKKVLKSTYSTKK